MTPYVGLVYCWFSPLLRNFFYGQSGFPLSTETNIFKFQLDQEWQMQNHYMDVLPLNCYFYFYLRASQLLNERNDNSLPRKRLTEDSSEPEIFKPLRKTSEERWKCSFPYVITELKKSSEISWTSLCTDVIDRVKTIAFL